MNRRFSRRGGRFPQMGRGQPGRGRRMVTGASKMGCLIRLLPVILFGAYYLYQNFAHRAVVPMTGRSQVVDMSPQEEMQLGFSSYQEILKKERIVPSGQQVDLIRKIGTDIAKVIGEGDPGFQWEFNLIESEQVNAFCLPGGKVAVYTGILPVAKNVAGVAAIMGHEIAHAIARHGAERMHKQKMMKFGQMAAGAAVGDMAPEAQRMVMGALGAGAQFGILLPFSRNHESEADYMGLIYAARACYDPREAPNLWVRMGEASGGSNKQSEFTSTHPSHETRISQLNAWMPEAIEVYTKSGCPPLQ